MPRLYIVAILIIWSFQLSAQQLYLEAFTGRNRTSFNLPIYTNPTWFSPLGAKIAFGLDHLQLGGEYSFNWSKPSFELKDTTIVGSHIYKHTYYGLLLRGKISRYPARRFGLTLNIGAGYMALTRTSKIDGEPASLAYSKTPSFNGGIGISIPTQGKGMIELGYTYYYVDFPKTDYLPAMLGSYYSIHIGYSLNFVFGKRAAEYDKIMKF